MTDLKEALAFYELNDYLQPYQCDVVVDEIERLQKCLMAIRDRCYETDYPAADMADKALIGLLHLKGDR